MSLTSLPSRPNPSMNSLVKVHSSHQPPLLSFNPSRPSFPHPISSFHFKTSSRHLKLPPFVAIQASSSQSPNPQTLNNLQSLINPILKTTFITLTAAAAIFLTRLPVRPAIAVSVPIATSSPETETETALLAKQEREIEDRLARNPKDTDALRSLMEVRIKSRKLLEAIEALDRLIELEPEEEEWPLMKSQIFIHSGDFESARKGLEEILEKDPFRVEAYHGLVMANAESGDSLKEVIKRIESAMERCKKEKRGSDLRDFKLLVAQVRVIEEKYGDALRVYEELVKEEPRDFRPYLCQGIIYTLMRKRDEAEKKFEQFKKLVPKDHPYREFFFDNLIASKFFAEKVERESVGPRS